MARSLKKGPFCDPKLLSQVTKAKEKAGKGKVVVKTKSRASTVMPVFIGVTVMVHNGKDYVPVLVTEEMVGHKFGEFSPTRIFRGHAGDKKTVKGK